MGDAPENKEAERGERGVVLWPRGVGHEMDEGEVWTPGLAYTGSSGMLKALSEAVRNQGTFERFEE